MGCCHAKSTPHPSPRPPVKALLCSPVVLGATGWGIKRNEVGASTGACGQRLAAMAAPLQQGLHTASIQQSNLADHSRTQRDLRKMGCRSAQGSEDLAHLQGHVAAAAPRTLAMAVHSVCMLCVSCPTHPAARGWPPVRAGPLCTRQQGSGRGGRGSAKGEGQRRAGLRGMRVWKLNPGKMALPLSFMIKLALVRVRAIVQASNRHEGRLLHHLCEQGREGSKAGRAVRVWRHLIRE